METISVTSDVDSDVSVDDSDTEVSGDRVNDNQLNMNDTKDDGDVYEEHIKPLLSNNFILPMEVEEARTSVPVTLDEKDLKKTKREKKNGRFYKFVKKHFIQRKSGSNDVKEIHILPEGDELRWARRSGGSAASRSSDETITSEDGRLEVVHDMAEEEMLQV